MKYCKHVVSLIVVLALALMVFGCAKPPEAEQKAAKTAMDAAITAGADKYAPADMDAATKLFGAAEAQMKDKKYEEAKKAYVDAKASFEKAAAAAAAGKKAIATEASAALTALEESWKNLQASANNVQKSLKKEETEEWEADIKSFEGGLKAGKEMMAANPAGTKATVDQLKIIVDKWDPIFKEKAAAPEKTKGKKGKK